MSTVTPFDEHRYVLNMGPQHPSTHGVLRVILEMEGEYVMDPQPVLGYGHRMHEKMAESRSWPGFLPNAARMDYLASLIYNHGYVGVIERLASIEATPRAEYIRVITSEMNRLQSHLLWLGVLVLDLGAFTPIMYTFEDREKLIDILEDITGTRLTYCYMRVGGVVRDIDEKFISRTREYIDWQRSRMPMYENLVTGNIIFRKRVEEIGEFTPDLARRYGVTGPVLRATGIPYDIRRAEPYSVYPEFDFEIPTETAGDCLATYKVRFREIEQSLRILEQALDKLPDGPVMAKVPKKIKLPAGDATYTVESPRGELLYHLTADGTDVPYRMKIRVPSFSNLSVLPEVCSGMLLSDLCACMGSLDLVIPEIDR